jgi:hypothetical protein
VIGRIYEIRPIIFHGVCVCVCVCVCHRCLLQRSKEEPQTVHIITDHRYGWNVQIAARKGYSVHKAVNLRCSKQVITGLQWLSNCGSQTTFLRRKPKGHCQTYSGTVINLRLKVEVCNSCTFCVHCVTEPPIDKASNQIITFKQSAHRQQLTPL